MADYIIPPIRSLIVLLTNQCNLACPYCFESRDTQRMSFDTAKDVLHFLHNNSDNVGFTFFGGEPMLEWDSIIVPLVEYSKSLSGNTRFSMTTNGTLLNRDKVDYVIDNNIQFMLSMDGDKPTQDCMRPCRNGDSSFDKLADILPYILEKRPYQQVRGTLTSASAGNFFHDIRWFEDHGVKDLAFMPNLFEEWTAEQKKELREQIQIYENYIMDSFRSGKVPVIFREYNKAFWRLVVTKRNVPRRSNNACPAERQCGFGVRGSGSCDVYGNIYGCHHVDLDPNSMWCIGNIYDGVDEARIKALVSMYDPQKVGGDKCKSCPIDSICNGGCTPNNWLITGDIHGVADMYCYWTRLITDSAYRITQTLGNENNTLFVNEFTARRWG